MRWNAAASQAWFPVGTVADYQWVALAVGALIWAMVMFVRWLSIQRRYSREHAARHVYCTRVPTRPTSWGPWDFRCPFCAYVCVGFWDKSEGDTKAFVHFTEHRTRKVQIHD